MKTTLTLLLAGALGALGLYGQDQFPVYPTSYLQNPLDGYIAIEAENYHVNDPDFGNAQTTVNWVTTSVTGAGLGNVLTTDGPPGQTTTPPGQSENPRSEALAAAKAQYLLQFTIPGTYYVYMRTQSPGNQNRAQEQVFLPLELNGLPTALGHFPDAQNLRWHQVSNGLNPLTYTVDNINELYNFSIRPYNGQLEIDRIVLHPEPNLSDAELQLLFDNPTVDGTASTLDTILRYTSFEGTAGEWEVLEDRSQNINIGELEEGHNGLSFAFAGQQFMVLDLPEQAGFKEARLALETVRFDCGYTDMDFCFRAVRTWPSVGPYDRLHLNFAFYDAAGNETIVSTEQIMEADFADLTDGYSPYCTSVPVPPGAVSVQPTLVLFSNNGSQDLFVDEVFLSGYSNTFPIATLGEPTTNGLTATFTLENVMNAGSFSWIISNLTPGVEDPEPTEFLTGTTFSYTFPFPGLKEVCVMAVDECGNFPILIGCTEFNLTGQILPVTWQSFSVTAEGSAARLDWTTANEENNEYFTVEYSRNGRDFSEIGRVAGSGTTAAATSYEFLHPPPASGVNYYRLRQVDFDGSYDYSPVRTLQMQSDAAAAYRVFPNPAPGQFWISAPVQDGAFHLYSSTGQRVLSGRLLGDAIEVNSLPAGLYVLQVEDAGGVVVHREQVAVR